MSYLRTEESEMQQNARRSVEAENDELRGQKIHSSNAQRREAVDRTEVENDSTLKIEPSQAALVTAVEEDDWIQENPWRLWHWATPHSQEAGERCVRTYTAWSRAGDACRVCSVCERWYWYGKDCISCYTWTCDYCLLQAKCMTCIREDEEEQLKARPCNNDRTGDFVSCGIGNPPKKLTAIPQAHQMVESRHCPRSAAEVRHPQRSQVINRKWNKIPKLTPALASECEPRWAVAEEVD